MTTHEASRIAVARPAHLRVDVRVGSDSASPDLRRAAVDAMAVGANLELAVAADDASGLGLADLAAILRGLDIGVSRVLVYLATDGFSALSSRTPATVVRLVKEALEPVIGDVPFAGGTNQNFSDINRDRPTEPDLEAVCFSTSPTVHAADDISVMENIAGQGEVVRMARSFSGDRAIYVSPVTLATRFGPYPAGPARPGDLPAAIDVRQASLLGAAWTTGALKHLAEAGAASVTFYETTGSRGVIETDIGDPMPDRFPSNAGAVFPLYHVLADLGELDGATVVDAVSSDPLRTEAIAVATSDRRTHVLVACLVPGLTRVELHGLPNGPATLRILDTSTAPQAMSDPDAFRTSGKPAHVRGGRIRLELGDYAVARLDTSPG